MPCFAVMRSMLLVGMAASARALVVSKPSLVAGTYPHISAIFGNHPAGATLEGDLVYLAGNGEGCAAFSAADLAAQAPGSGAVLLMINRGGCNFVQKVRNAQLLSGATGGRVTAAIVVSDDEFPYIMGDDGSGDDITLPSVMIAHGTSSVSGDDINSGLLVYAAGQVATGSRAVIGSVAYPAPPPAYPVAWELWSSANVEGTAEGFKVQFAPVAKALELSGAAEFTPRFALLDGAHYGCTHASPRSSTGFACDKQCTNSGRYCAEDPERDIAAGIFGGDVVQEALRQMCIVQVLKEAPRSMHSRGTMKWWTYVGYFNDNCRDMSSEEREKCSTTQQTNAGIDAEAVTTCLLRSGGVAYDGEENSVLAQEIADRAAKNIFAYPLLRVGDVQYGYQPSCPSPRDNATCAPLRMICEAMAAGTRPATCSAPPQTVPATPVPTPLGPSQPLPCTLENLALVLAPQFAYCEHDDECAALLVGGHCDEGAQKCTCATVPPVVPTPTPTSPPTGGGGGGGGTSGVAVGLGLGLPAAAVAGFMFVRFRRARSAAAHGGTGMRSLRAPVLGEQTGGAPSVEMAAEYSQL